jgi:hypothetical protein
LRARFIPPYGEGSRRITLAGFLLIYLSGFNVLLARYAGTCTMGDSDRLFGGVYSLLFYLAGFALLYRARPSNIASLAILPLLPLFAWQTWFSIDLFHKIVFFGASACDVLEGETGRADWQSDRFFFAFLWLAMSTVALAGAAITFRRAAAKGTG